MKFTIRMVDLPDPISANGIWIYARNYFFEMVFTIAHDTPPTMLNQDFICIHVYLCSYNIASAPQRAQL